MIYFQLFYTFFLIGLFTFGGGYAMIPMITEQVVGKGWITAEALTDFIAISEVTPGPFAINIATFIGTNVAGIGGAILTTLGVILPSIIIILIIAAILTKAIKNKYVQGALNGVKPIVLGLIFSTALLLLIKTIFFAGSSVQSDFNFDRRSFVLLIIIAGFSFIYTKVKKKSLSPILLLGLSALLGLIIFKNN